VSAPGLGPWRVWLIAQARNWEVGKFSTLHCSDRYLGPLLTDQFNPNHRHDEEHEKATDEKRTKISESHRFQSFAPERPANNVKWYVDGRDYFWVRIG
jgi:hypothetical protein